jgi:hypothetical protein
MRNLLLSSGSFLGLMFLCSNVNAQEPAQSTHEKKVYLNDGNTYVQKQLPVYLKFSTSSGGQQYDLKSKVSAKYTDPMYLDTEGINYIRSKWAVDKNTKKTIAPKQEIMYELYADGLAPRTVQLFKGAPKHVSGKVYFGKGLTSTLMATDLVSGVEHIHYALNAQTWTDYSSILTIDTEGEYNLYYYANDHVGNAEKTKDKSFIVDLTPPTSSHAIKGIVYNENILAPSTKFNLSKSDALSGVRTTRYSFDEKSDITHVGNINMSGLSDGDHILYYYSIDKVKNEEQKIAIPFYLDRIPPVVENQVNGDQYKGKYLYVSPRTNLSFSATDNKAGVKTIFYRIDGTERNDYSAAISIPNVKGLHTFKYDGNDNVENLSKNKYLTVYMDNVAPTTGIRYGKPQFFTRDTLFINKDTKISLFASDYESGVQKVSYKIDGAGYQEYAQFNIPDEGVHTTNFKTTDRVNNEEQEKTSFVYIDNAPPTIYHNFSIESIGIKKELKIYPNYSRLYLGATDDKVGTQTIMYSINEGPMVLYSSSTTLDISENNKFLKKNIKYSVKVIAKDKLGNTSEKVIKFYGGVK